jgi:hypothetical protein
MLGDSCCHHCPSTDDTRYRKQIVKTETKSPLKDQPLRQPGESIRERQWDIVFDDMMVPAFVGLFLCVFAALQWWYCLSKMPPSPYFATILALGAVGYAVYKWRKAQREQRNLRLGREGEEICALVLDFGGCRLSCRSIRNETK